MPHYWRWGRWGSMTNYRRWGRKWVGVPVPLIPHFQAIGNTEKNNLQNMVFIPMIKLVSITFYTEAIEL
jgi:hypothetical protein